MENHRKTTFHQDSAPCHKAKKVMKFLENKKYDIIKWPGNSPDLNPIENAWNFMKERLKTLDMSSSTKLELAIKDLWKNGLTDDYFENLVKSMPNRLQMVINNKGHMTRVL